MSSSAVFALLSTELAVGSSGVKAFAMGQHLATPKKTASRAQLIINVSVLINEFKDLAEFHDLE